MTLRIEKDSDGQTTTLRLIGRMRREHLEELKAQIKAGGTSVTLDLSEVKLVYLMQLDNRLMLVDTGAGELLGPKLDKLPDSLRSVGLR